MKKMNIKDSNIKYLKLNKIDKENISDTLS